MRLNVQEAAIVRGQTRSTVTQWHRATAADLADGLGWYQRASGLADSLAVDAPITREQAAGVIAALSPRCGWSVNVGAAVKLVDAYAAGAESAPIVAGVPRSREMAWAIFCDSTHDPLDHLGLHALQREGKRFRDDAPRGRRYELIAESYRRAAQVIGVDARDVQAAVWTAIRRREARAIYDLPPTGNANQGAPMSTRTEHRVRKVREGQCDRTRSKHAKQETQRRRAARAAKRAAQPTTQKTATGDTYDS